MCTNSSKCTANQYSQIVNLDSDKRERAREMERQGTIIKHGHLVTTLVVRQRGHLVVMSHDSCLGFSPKQVDLSAKKHCL